MPSAGEGAQQAPEVPAGGEAQLPADLRQRQALRQQRARMGCEQAPPHIDWRGAEFLLAGALQLPAGYAQLTRDLVDLGQGKVPLQRMREALGHAPAERWGRVGRREGPARPEAQLADDGVDQRVGSIRGEGRRDQRI